MAKLIIQLEGEERDVELTTDVSSIGRSADCVIPIQHRSLSRRHCEIHRVGSGYVVRDCGSLNGTLVNGKKIAADHPLQPGDRIDVGAARVYFERVAEKPAPAPSPAPIPEESVGVPLVETAGVMPAYVAWSRHGAGGMAGAAVWVAACGAILLVGFLVIGWLARSGGPVQDRDNLLVNASFEALAAEQLPAAWSLPMVQSRLMVGRQDAKHGQRCLVVEKMKGVPSEFVLACVSESPIDIARYGERFEISGWIRTQRLKGAAALRCVARSVGGLVIGQQWSPPVRESAPWTEVRCEFVAPRGAKHFTLECVVVGPEGTAAFDGLRVVRRGGEPVADAGRDFELKSYSAQVWPDGTFHVLYKMKDGGREARRWVLAHGRLVLRTPHGTVDQSVAPGAPPAPAPAPAGSGVATVASFLLHPGTMQWLPVRMTLEEVDGELQVVYQFAGDGLRAEDELGVEIASPLDPNAGARVVAESGEKVADLSDVAAKGIRRFIWHDREAAYTLRYPFPVTLSGGRRTGVLRLGQYAGPGRLPESGAAFGFGLSVTLQRQLADLEKALIQGRDAERQGRLTEAIDIYRRVEDEAREKDPGAAAEAEGRRQAIEAAAKADLEQARRALVAVHVLNADAPSVSAASKLLAGLSRRYKQSPWSSDVEALRAEVEAAVAEREPARDPGGLYLRQAEFFLGRGDVAMARVFLDWFDRDGKRSPHAAEAAELRRKMEAPPGGAGEAAPGDPVPAAPPANPQTDSGKN